jgi:hypothetical protein
MNSVVKNSDRFLKDLIPLLVFVVIKGFRQDAFERFPVWFSYSYRVLMFWSRGMERDVIFPGELLPVVAPKYRSIVRADNLWGCEGLNPGVFEYFDDGTHLGISCRNGSSETGKIIDHQYDVFVASACFFSRDWVD